MNSNVIETHISRVVLAGDWAYKVKKPVRLPFLDFSTAEQRRLACKAEWQLNRRTAPDVYVDVLPLSLRFEALLEDPAHALARSHPDTATDWVLRMRRFPDGAVWSVLAGQGALTPTHMDAVAAHLADFHQGLPPVPVGWEPDKPLVQWMQDSLDAIAQHPDRPDWLTPDRWQAVNKTLMGSWAALAPWASQRQSAGWVRECHGDLHLGNVVQWQGVPVAFDGIEFSTDLRCIDVMNDAAFLFMDLCAQGLSGLAWRFINRYVERTGDFDGLRALPVWAAYRALVRAQVALLSGQSGDPFERYWRCAEQMLRPAPVLLVAMQGVSGSGKSTAAEYLVEAMAAHGGRLVRVRSDVERKRLHGLAPSQRGGPELYTAEATRRTYDRLQALARDLLASGLSVVVDAACLRQSEREALRQLALQASADFWLLECVAGTEQLHARLLQREVEGQDASDATSAVLDRQWVYTEPVPADWAPWHTRLHNDGTTEGLAAQVRAWGDGHWPAVAQAVAESRG